MAPLQAIRVPAGSASGLPRSCARSCHVLPPGGGGRWDASPGAEGGAHQRLPTDRTVLGRRFRPFMGLGVPVHRHRRLHRIWPHLRPTPGPCRALGLCLHPPTPHVHGPDRRHMQEPAPAELLQGQPPRPCFRLAPGAFGPLLLGKDDLLAIAGAQPPLRQRPAAPIAGQGDEPPLP